MKKLYVKIDGITCNHCKQKITTELTKINNIKNISFDGHIAEIEYIKSISKNRVVQNIIDIGYTTNLKMISDDIRKLKRNITFSEITIITVILILISVILNKIFGLNIFNMIPTIDSKITYAMLFVVGLLTSIHCISMCGAINLVASSSNNKNFKNPVFYNLGRLISYTLLGGIVGLLGSVFELNTYAQGIIIIVASIFMLLMALNMMGIVNVNLKVKTPKVFGKLKSRGSFIIGLLNGLMPCGPLQTMQIYALSTGSFIYGAISMFLFCVGTMPLMLFVGMIFNLLKNNHRKVMLKISTVLILILSLVMFNRGLLQMGVDVSRAFKPNYDNYLKTVLINDHQYVEFDLTYSGYEDIVVQKGIPVKLVINASNSSLTGCNNSIKIPTFNIKKDLSIGENIIEFTPNETGTFVYTCWMSMLKNNIVVVDDINLFGMK